MFNCNDQKIFTGNFFTGEEMSVIKGKKLDLSEIKKVELRILLEFDKFCKANDLRYYLAGGTLLGAIRHRGFIPWDDDIDVCMPRDDYERLQSIGREINGLLLKSNKQGNASIPFSKLVDPKTKIDLQFVDNDYDNNLWIDIFPVDGLPKDFDEVKAIYSKCNFYRRIFLLSDAKLGEGKTFFKKYAKYLLQPFVRIYGKRRCIENIERLAAKYPYAESEYVGIVTWGLYGAGERMLKSEFEQVVEVEFEGHGFPAFSCWDSYLRGLYHDYMQLPPLEKRQTHDMVAYLLEEGEE